MSCYRSYHKHTHPKVKYSSEGCDGKHWYVSVNGIRYEDDYHDHDWWFETENEANISAAKVRLSMSVCLACFEEREMELEEKRNAEARAAERAAKYPTLFTIYYSSEGQDGKHWFIKSRWSI